MPFLLSIRSFLKRMVRKGAMPLPSHMFMWACHRGCLHFGTNRYGGMICLKWMRDLVNYPAWYDTTSMGVRPARIEECLRYGRTIGIRVPVCNGVLLLPEENT